MPTYEYKCQKCQIKIDVMHKMDEFPNIICDKCYDKMAKGFGGGSGIHFKGSGFYETDYRGK